MVKPPSDWLATCSVVSRYCSYLLPRQDGGSSLIYVKERIYCPDVSPCKFTWTEGLRNAGLLLHILRLCLFLSLLPSQSNLRCHDSLSLWNFGEDFQTLSKLWHLHTAIWMILTGVAKRMNGLQVEWLLQARLGPMLRVTSANGVPKIMVHISEPAPLSL